MNPDNQHDLDWLAFLYLADEMDETERLAFDKRLADCQAAREALARGVELTHTLSVAERVQHISLNGSEVSRWRRAAWTAAAVAACLSLLLAYQFSRDLVREPTSPIAQGNGIAVKSPHLSKQLAFAWMETVDELARADNPELITQFLTEADALSSYDTPLSDDESELTAPDWMFAAVSGLAGNMDELPEMDQLLETMRETVEN